MEKEDETRLRKSVQDLKEWADKGSRCVLVIAGDEEGGFSVVRRSSCLRMAEVIANAIHGRPDLIASVKIGVAAAEEYIRSRKEKKRRKQQSSK